jgi:hypothetical protein
MFQMQVRMQKRRKKSAKVEEKEVRKSRQTLLPFLLQKSFQMVSTERVVTMFVRRSHSQYD